ncbi:hypothetical protein BC827DRAFT_752525 [Russula dissimulans]|nr:hypothetical protein BC827DRAFT_752525 [Russula dissimulans]
MQQILFLRSSPRLGHYKTDNIEDKNLKRARMDSLHFCRGNIRPLFHRKRPRFHARLRTQLKVLSIQPLTLTHIPLRARRPSHHTLRNEYAGDIPELQPCRTNVIMMLLHGGLLTPSFKLHDPMLH